MQEVLLNFYWGGTQMSGIKLKNLNKIYPNGFTSVKDVSLTIEDGEFVIFHGPSGCGKSTILRMIGGLEDITSGEIYLGDELLNDILPRDRKLAMAFQNYRLYGYLSAYENIALGLKLRNMPRNVIDTRVKTAVKFFDIEDVLNKKITELTDSQKQKVALCRAIVCHPKILLVDEDFAHGNDELRKDMLHDIQKINKELQTTVLYVTNNYDEATSLVGKLVLMKDGQVINQ